MALLESTSMCFTHVIIEEVLGLKNLRPMSGRYTSPLPTVSVLHVGCPASLVVEQTLAFGASLGSADIWFQILQEVFPGILLATSQVMSLLPSP